VKVLIAGGAGFLGSTVASACLDAGITPIILDNLSTGRVEFTQDRIFYLGDIADGPLLDKIFSDHPDIAAVVHMAAMIVVPDSVAHPLRYYRENVARTVDFVDHVVRNGCPRFVFSSSAAIYRPGDDLSVDESSPLDPQSPYARTKAMVEEFWPTAPWPTTSKCCRCGTSTRSGPIRSSVPACSCRARPTCWASC